MDSVVIGGLLRHSITKTYVAGELELRVSCILESVYQPCTQTLFHRPLSTMGSGKIQRGLRENSYLLHLLPPRCKRNPASGVLPLKGMGYLNQAQDTKLEPGTPNRNASALLSAFWLFLNLYEATVPWHSDRGE